MRYILLFTALLFTNPEALAGDVNVLLKNHGGMAAPPSPDSRTNNVLIRRDHVATCPNEKDLIENIGSEEILVEYFAWKNEVCKPQDFHMAYRIRVLDAESDELGCPISVTFSCENPKDPGHEDLI